MVKEGVAGKGVETGKVRARTENRIFTRQMFMYVCVSISYPPPPSHSQLILLRFCNSVTARLLRTSSANLIGSMLTFLSSNFAVTERSGVNLKGELRGGEYEVEEEEGERGREEKTKAKPALG